jgi:hypothetical protein
VDRKIFLGVDSVICGCYEAAPIVTHSLSEKKKNKKKYFASKNVYNKLKRDYFTFF